MISDYYCEGCFRWVGTVDKNSKCIICARLDKIERKLEILKGIASIKDIWKSILQEK